MLRSENSGVVTLANALQVGTTAGKVCAGDDSRLSNARTPVPHSATLITSDTIAVAQGGTGSATAPMVGVVTAADATAARAVMNAAATNHDHSGANITSGLVADDYVDLRVDAGASFDGQGSVIASSKTVLVPIERAGVITSVSLVGDAAGSITVDLKRYTPNGFGAMGTATDLGSIQVSTRQFLRDTTLTGWTKSLSAGDVLSFTTSGTIATVTQVVVKVKIETS